jgi:hypothetical protein
MFARRKAQKARRAALRARRRQVDVVRQMKQREHGRLVGALALQPAYAVVK